MTDRKIIQIQPYGLGIVEDKTVVALCDDGTLWILSPLTALWQRVASPQTRDEALAAVNKERLP